MRSYKNMLLMFVTSRPIRVLRKCQSKIVPVIKQHYVMETYGGVDLWTHFFLTSPLEVSGQLHAMDVLLTGKESPVSTG
jgi:hypothetical protein